jgi:hypothetical protein
MRTPVGTYSRLRILLRHAHQCQELLCLVEQVRSSHFLLVLRNLTDPSCSFFLTIRLPRRCRAVAIKVLADTSFTELDIPSWSGGKPPDDFTASNGARRLLSSLSFSQLNYSFALTLSSSPPPPSLSPSLAFGLGG